MCEDHQQILIVKKEIDEAIRDQKHRAVCKGYQELAQINFAMARFDMALNALALAEALVKKYNLGFQLHMQILLYEIEIYIELSDIHYAGYKLSHIEQQCLESNDEELIESVQFLKSLLKNRLELSKVY